MALGYPWPTANPWAATCWVHLSALTPPCSDIWQSLVYVPPPPAPHRPPRAAMVESYFLYFLHLRSLAPGWPNPLPAQSSRGL